MSITKIIGSTLDDNSRLDLEVVVSLKYLSNCYRSLDLALINCEIELYLSWLTNCITSELSRTAPVASNQSANPPVQLSAAAATTSARFQTNATKLYVPVVALSINENIKF